MRADFLNDQSYSNGQEDPREALRETLAFAVDDWGATRAMSWTWGIVHGWEDDAMAEQAALHGWDEATTARLNRLHEAFDRLIEPVAPDPDEPNSVRAWDVAARGKP